MQEQEIMKIRLGFCLLYTWKYFKKFYSDVYGLWKWCFIDFESCQQKQESKETPWDQKAFEEAEHIADGLENGGLGR